MPAMLQAVVAEAVFGGKKLFIIAVGFSTPFSTLAVALFNNARGYLAVALLDLRIV